MSNEADLNFYVDWLEKSIANDYFQYYEYSDFKNIQPIGNGNFRKVSRVSWKDTDTIFALKSFDNYKLTLKEVVNEVQIIL